MSDRTNATERVCVLACMNGDLWARAKTERERERIGRGARARPQIACDCYTRCCMLFGCNKQHAQQQNHVASMELKRSQLIRSYFLRMVANFLGIVWVK